jgi:hypothetical protein
MLAANSSDMHPRQWNILLTWKLIRRDTFDGYGFPVAGPWPHLRMYEVFVRRIASNTL